MYRFLVAIPLGAATMSPQDTVAVRPVYESARLDSLVSEASRINARIPDRLRAYRARIETEMSLALIDSAGRERTGQLEQIASDVRWRATDRYDQRVIGYRSQAVGPMFSMMSIFGGWTTPTLYGNQLQLGVTPAMSARIARDRIARDTSSLTIHPLSASRDSYYRFEGGDTAVVLYSRGRRIPVVRVRVTPRSDARGNAILFFGDLYLDADRKQMVRMRGRLVELRNGRQTLSTVNSGFPHTSAPSSRRASHCLAIFGRSSASSLDFAIIT